MNRSPFWISLVGLATLALAASNRASLTALTLTPQTDKPAGTPAYTEEQSTRGQDLSTKQCDVCHGDGLKGSDLAPALQSDDFLKAWSDKTAGDLFDKVQTTMPGNRPGSLSNEQVADLLAYILKLNHFPAGQEPLRSDPAALSATSLAPKP